MSDALGRTMVENFRAIEAERDKMRAIIDRAADDLSFIETRELRRLFESSLAPMAAYAALEMIESARRILAESDPKEGAAEP